MFTAAQAAQKIKELGKYVGSLFTAAQAAQKIRGMCMRSLIWFTAAQAAQKVFAGGFHFKDGFTAPDGQVKFPHPWPPQIPPGRTTRL